MTDRSLVVPLIKGQLLPQPHLSIWQTTVIVNNGLTPFCTKNTIWKSSQQRCSVTEWDCTIIYQSLLYYGSLFGCNHHWFLLQRSAHFMCGLHGQWVIELTNGAWCTLLDWWPGLALSMEEGPCSQQQSCVKHTPILLIRAPVHRHHNVGLPLADVHCCSWWFRQHLMIFGIHYTIVFI